MVDPSYVSGMHEKHRGTAAADDIAWFFVVNGLYGECEGDVPCYVDWENRLHGWSSNFEVRNGSHAGSN